MQVGVGYSNDPDSVTAGRQAAEMALMKAHRTDACDLVLFFCTDLHDRLLLREGIVRVAGPKPQIFGGGAVGVVTSEDFGYAGNQVGVIMLWQDGSICSAIALQSECPESEIDIGRRLGKQLEAVGVKPESPALLFYGPAYCKDDTRPPKGTWLLKGIEKGLGFLPDIAGAGMKGDYLCREVPRYTSATGICSSVFALTFSNDICLDTTVIHGCSPITPYHTVTRSAGPVIYEIDGVPALTLLNDLLGTALSPREYPFSLIFGVNYGDCLGEYAEENFVNRLCIGIDEKLSAVMMSEPDMHEGTRFQLMSRPLELTYIKPKIEEAMSKLGGREPILAVYIDCAGRCAGYGNMEMEDALAVKNLLGDKVPFLGIYAGTELAGVGGRPRALDWTGVLCVLTRKSGEHTSAAVPVIRAHPMSGNGQLMSNEEMRISSMPGICKGNSAKIVKLSAQYMELQYELEHMRCGFNLLAELTVFLRHGRIGSGRAVYHVAQRISAVLGMHKTAALIPGEDGKFTPFVLHGYTAGEKDELMGCQFDVDPELLKPGKGVLVTAEDNCGRFADLRRILKLPYFVSVPIITKNKAAALLITGRIAQSPPFIFPLGRCDIDTLTAIGDLLSSVMFYQQRLDDANKQAQLDVLTGLLNRGAFELRAINLLQQDLPFGVDYAFIVIDIDYFKRINDCYGHIVGDEVLKRLAAALRKFFRSTDLIGRMGGDEFSVFCSYVGDVEQLTRRIKKFLDIWNKAQDTENTPPVQATLSLGIAVAPKDATAYKELFHKADIALYKSKQRGRNRYTLYDPETMSDI